MGQFGAVEVNADYSESVQLTVELECLHVEAFTQSLINKSGAKIFVTSVENS